MVVDANVYWFPEDIFRDKAYRDAFLDDIRRKKEKFGYLGYEEEREDGQKQIVIEKPEGKQNLNYVMGEYRLEQILADMDLAGVDKAVLKLPGCQEWLDLDLCRRFNDGMHAFAEKSKGRLVPLAVVPPYGRKENIDELERCIHELDMHAVQLSAHYGGQYLDDNEFAEFFEKLNEYKMTAYIHHTPLPVEYNMIVDYNNLRRSYGRCTDQTIAIGRELFGGLFSRYPDMKFVHSMLGGGFFTYMTMLMPHVDKAEKVKRFEAENGEIQRQVKQNLFFEMSHAQPWGKELLECAVKILGADHIIYGSSYPVKKEWMTGGPEFVKKLELFEKEKQLILHENAERLYGIERSR